jgi:hypothetical protein
MTTRHPILVALLLCLAHGAGRLDAAQSVAHEFENLSNANASFPQVFFFRGDDAPPRYLDDSAAPQTRQAFLNRLDGCISKVFHEERTELPTDKLLATYRALRAQHPEKAVLVHFNGEAVAVRHFDWIAADRYHADNLKDYFPGHWVFQSGARLMNSITAHDTVLKVDLTRPFTERDYVFGNARKRGEDVAFPTDILLVPVAADGTRRWHRSEYATFVSKSKTQIIVKRGRYGSTPRAFEGGKTLVLPFAGGSWADNSMWYFNFSPDCPRDPNGLQAADIYVRNLVAWIKPPGQPPFACGIAFDVMAFNANSAFDTNNDSVPDGGLMDGVNRWRLGVNAMLANLRHQLGDEAIITADSHNPDSQRAVALLNGMESEGLVTHNDAYRAISTTLNLQAYWLKYGRPPHFSYIVDKVKNEHDLAQLPCMTKLAHGVATALGVGIGMGGAGQHVMKDKSPYLYGESPSSGKSGWLGRPTSGLLLLTSGPTFTDATAGVSSAKPKDSILKKTGAREWVLSSQTTTPLASALGLVIEDVDLTHGFTLKIELKSSEPIAGLEPYPTIPRSVTARLTGNLSYAKDATLNRQSTECQGVAGAAGWHINTFHFRANPEKHARLEITIQDSGDLLLRNPEIMYGPLVVGRRFEHGAIILNLSEQPWHAPAEALGDLLKPAPPTPADPLNLGPLETRFLNTSGKSF